MGNAQNSVKNPRRGKTPARMLEAWERTFRSEFAQDGGAMFEPLLARFGLKGDAKAMLEGTVDFVIASAAFARLDGAAVEELLASQRYDSLATAAVYVLTFDMHGLGAARLLVSPGLRSVDLADLYEHPWHRLQRVGYSDFWISRLDGVALEGAEIDELHRLVSDDIMFDCDDDEISIIFDPDTYDGALAFSVYDTPEEDRGYVESPAS
jgi:hypothetical protein